MRDESMDLTTADSTGYSGTVTDRQLIDAILSGVRVQPNWDALLSRYSHFIYNVPRRYGLQESDAADVFQDVCEALWKGLPTVRNQDRLGGWLLSVAGHISWRVIIKRHRHRQRETSLDDTAVPLSDSGPGPDELLVRGEEWDTVAAAVQSLPERCRDLVRYLYYDPAMLSYEEIAIRMGLAEGSIGPVRGRCLARLKQLLRSGPDG